MGGEKNGGGSAEIMDWYLVIFCPYFFAFPVGANTCALRLKQLNRRGRRGKYESRGFLSRHFLEVNFKFNRHNSVAFPALLWSCVQGK